MLANFLINPQRKTVDKAFKLVFGDFDDKAEGYPKVPRQISWGEMAKVTTALPWQGTMAVVYLFTDDKYQHHVDRKPARGFWWRIRSPTAAVAGSGRGH